MVCIRYISFSGNCQIKNAIPITLKAVLKSVTRFATHASVSHCFCAQCHSLYAYFIALLFFCQYTSHLNLMSSKQFVLLSVRSLDLPLSGIMSSLVFVFFIQTITKNYHICMKEEGPPSVNRHLVM